MTKPVLRWWPMKSHAGTAPLRPAQGCYAHRGRHDRRPAGADARPADPLRCTVGRIEVLPNSPNTVPAKVTFSIDFRHPEAAVLEQRSVRIAEVCRRYAGPCEVTVTKTFERAPCAFPERIVGAIETAAQALGIAHIRLPSGAFHDANFIADLAPTGMIFVPCAKGISHSPAESSADRRAAGSARARSSLANQQDLLDQDQLAVVIELPCRPEEAIRPVTGRQSVGIDEALLFDAAGGLGLVPDPHGHDGAGRRLHQVRQQRVRLADQAHDRLLL